MAAQAPEPVLFAEPTQIIAVRHGQTAWNATQRVQGHQDVELDDIGRWQALCLAQALAEAGLSAIHSSDLARARDTALAVGRQAGLPVATHTDLRERFFGHFEGLTYPEVEARWPADRLRWRQREPAFQPGGGECLSVFSARCIAAFLRLARAHRGQTIAIVAHGGVLDCLYRAAVGAALDAPRSWQLANATINRLMYTGEGFQLVGWDDRRHLDGDGADVSGRQALSGQAEQIGRR